MPYPNEHAARLHDPKRYKRVRRENDKLGDGVHAIWGVLPDGTVELQAIRFDKSKFTADEARAWLKEHDYAPILFEPAISKSAATTRARKWLAVPFALKQGGYSEDDEYFHFKGYASTFGNRDLSGDIMLPGAFKETLRERMPKVCWQHDTRDPIGVLDLCEEDEKGLYLEGRMPKANQHCCDIAALIKCGAVDSMSIGYQTVDAVADRDSRKLKKVKLWEVSFVTIPMNDQARAALKSCTPFQDFELADRDAPWDAVEAVKRLRAHFGVTDDGVIPDEYAKTFLWRDPAGALQLPIADVIDGKLFAVPRAVFAAAAALQGYKGDVDLPADALAEVKQNLGQYYDKLSLVAPWDEDDATSEAAIDRIVTMKDVNEFLRSKGLSNVERTGIIAKIKAVADDSRNEKALTELLRNAEFETSLKTALEDLKAMTGAAQSK